MARRVQISNLVSQQKAEAEAWLKNFQDANLITKNFSGITTPKYGNYIFVWQFHKNKLVGATMIHVNNVGNFYQKLKNSLKSPGFNPKQEENGSSNPE